MFGFGKDKKKEEEAEQAAKAEQEKVAQAMRNMSDQLAAKGKEVADLQKQLDAAKKDAASGDAAEKALAEAQAKVRQMQADMAKLQIQAQSAQNKAKQAAAAAAKVEAKPEPGVSLGGAAGAPATAPGMLGVGVSAWVRNAGGKNLRLRDKPGLQSNAFAGLPPGTQMTLLEGPVQDDGYPWWRVRVSDGREGWVAGTELVTEPE
ncbi:MAG TPA: SH3 domain-containing protein [Chloroflexaceae bacterium]|nr:SH3 domain-containing protein [Chloroflexaceae bacterium]